MKPFKRSDKSQEPRPTPQPRPTPHISVSYRLISTIDGKRAAGYDIYLSDDLLSLIRELIQKVGK